VIACFLSDARTVGAIALALGILSATPVRAQDEGEPEAEATEAPENAEARAHFDRGTQAFDVGDYETAAREFTAAYELTEHPDLLFNVYSAQERNGNLEAAEEALRGYLADASPDSERRQALEARLARLQARLAEARAADAEERARLAEEEARRRQEEEARRAEGAHEDEAVSPPPDPVPTADTGPHPAAIASFVVAGVGLVSFGVFAALSEVEDQNLASTCGRDVPTASCSDVTALEVYNVVADASWITAATAGVLGLVLLFALEGEGGDEQAAGTRWAPWVGLGAAGLSAEGSF
jgi:hypothetical protein